MASKIQTHFSKLLLIKTLLLFLFINPSSYSSLLSTFSISETSTQTIVCSLIPSQNNTNNPTLNCTSFPVQTQIPFTISPNISISAVTSGAGFFCLLRSFSPSSSITTLSCSRFSGSDFRTGYGYGTGTDTAYKRIYKGPILDELVAGDSHICGRITRTNRIECWQWPGFPRINDNNISRISVGGEFLCGLTEFGEIKCFGTDRGVVDREPVGNYSVVSAGYQHSCAISTYGKIHCWGEIARGVPEGEFKSLASGRNRSCAIRDGNGTVACWGENDFKLPKSLLGTEFSTIEAKSQIFCGIVTLNYSLFCWGNEFFDRNPMVFPSVQPGSCSNSSHCSCGILSGSGAFCSGGAICLPCRRVINNENAPPSSPSPPPTEPLPPSPSSLPLPLPSPPPESSPSTSDKQRVIFIVIGCAGTFSLVIVCSFFLFRFCKGRVTRVHDSGPIDQAGSTRIQVPQNSPEPEFVPEPEPELAPVFSEKRLSQMLSMGTSLEEFSLDMLIQITDGFSDDFKIGQGSFGSVYRANLVDGREVAIKRASLATNKHKQEKENAFLSELSHLSRLNHKNLVRLFGYCDEGNEQLLVYEFMINGTLHDHLHKLDNSPLNSWISRIKIALDAARGIEYLHTYAVPSIIHRDIKSSNILLDGTFTAKVADFGLSLLGPHENETHLSLKAAGTLGYMDPEYYRLQKLTAKSDVYSFGVLLLEMLSGYKAIHPNENDTPRNIVDFVMPYIVNDNVHRIFDRRVPAPTPFEIEAVTYVGYLAADCVNLEGRNRPFMTEVVNCLEKALAACEVSQILSRSTTRSST